MRLNSKVAVLVAGAMLVLAASVATAYAAAAQQDVALQVGTEQGSGYFGNYGDEVVLQPASMTSMMLPGDKFHFQVWVNDVDASGTVTPKWMDFLDFEDIQLEDTNTVPPLGFAIGVDDAVLLSNGSVIFPTPPYQIHCEYKPLGSSSDPKSFSETETVNAIKNFTRVKITNGVVRRAGTYFKFQVSSNCGVGKVKVSVKKAGAATKTYTFTTNEDGIASAKIKLGSRNGLYTVSAKFLGNSWGTASATASKSVRASR